MSDLDVVDEEVCPHCGTELEERMLPTQVDADGGNPVIRYQLACPNPDCPAVQSNLAPLADGQS